VDTTKLPSGSATLTAQATDASQAVGTSAPVAVTITNGTTPPAAVTLSQIQTAVFSPICSVCHNGSQPAGGALPGSMDLRNGNSFASLVNVPSQEKPGLLRIKPGDPANSYLVHKIVGAPDIVGSRMPLGGPFLDPATIDRIDAWIAAGAPNN
jgi:hypothetical protein